MEAMIYLIIIHYIHKLFYVLFYSFKKKSVLFKFYIVQKRKCTPQQMLPFCVLLHIYLLFF